MFFFFFCGIMTNLFIARFLARCALIGARRCSSAKRRARAAFTSLADSDPGHLEARVSRVRQHDKLLRPTEQIERHGRGLGTRTEAEGRRPGPGPRRGVKRDPSGGGRGEQHVTQRMP